MCLRLKSRKLRVNDEEGHSPNGECPSYDACRLSRMAQRQGVDSDVALQLKAP